MQIGIYIAQCNRKSCVYKNYQNLNETLTLDNHEDSMA